MTSAADAPVLVGSTPPQRSIPDATVARLAIYLRAIDALDVRDVISSQALAQESGVSSATLRKDLSYLGSFGTRGVGYDVAGLRERIAAMLGVDERRGVVIIGVGHLGHAIAGYSGLLARGFNVIGLFDPEQVGEVVDGTVVRSLDELRDNAEQYAGSIGIIATPAHAAADALALLVEVGITAVLNFAAAVLEPPPGIDVRQVDLASELQILSFRARHRAAARVPQGGAQ